MHACMFEWYYLKSCHYFSRPKKSVLANFLDNLKISVRKNTPHTKRLTGCGNRSCQSGFFSFFYISSTWQQCKLAYRTPAALPLSLAFAGLSLHTTARLCVMRGKPLTAFPLGRLQIFAPAAQPSTAGKGRRGEWGGGGPGISQSCCSVWQVNKKTRQGLLRKRHSIWRVKI